MINDPKFPHSTPGTGFMVEAKGQASPEAQVKYLMQVLKSKEDRIATLETELKALEIKRDLAAFQEERRINEFIKAADYFRGRAPSAVIPAEAAAWLEWRMRPWWLRMITRPKKRYEP